MSGGYGGLEVAIGRKDAPGAGVAGRVALLRRARDGDGARARSRGELDRSESDPAAGAEDEHGLSRADAAALDEGDPRGLRSNRKCGGFGVAQPLGDGANSGEGRCDDPGETAETHAGEDPRTGLRRRRDRGAGREVRLHDRSSDFHAGNEGEVGFVLVEPLDHE